MRDSLFKKRKMTKAAKFLSWGAVSLLVLMLLILAGFSIFLETELPAQQLSSLVTSQLQQNFTVKEIGLSGGTVTLKGVRLANPPGFQTRDLASADVLSFSPRWLELLRGRQRYDGVVVQGGRLNLEKNSQGAWNFAELQRRLAEKKRPEEPPPPETIVGKLLVKNGAVTIQGQGVQGIDLQVFNLTSGGSRQAQVELVFEDKVRNRYLLKGTARPGKEPAVDLSLTAGSISLKGLAGLLKLENQAALERARGSLQANAVMRAGELRSSGTFLFSNVDLPAPGRSYPIGGTLRFSGSYAFAEDTAYLNEATLSIPKMAQLQGEGNVRRVKAERDYSLLLALDQVDLALLNVLTSADARKNLLVGGRVSCETLRVEGSMAKGVESAVGRLQLSGGSAADADRLYVTGLNGIVRLTHQRGMLSAAGKMTVSSPDEKALLEKLDLPFEAALSSRLKPVRGRSSAFSARVMGMALTGSASYDAARQEPLRSTVKAAAPELQRLNQLLDRYGLEASAGAASGTAELAGSGAQELKADVQVQLSNFRGTRDGEALGVKGAAVTATLLKQGERLHADGNARLNDVVFSGRSADAAFGFRLADRTLHLTDFKGGMGPTRFSASALSAVIPAAVTQAGASRYPLQIDLAGGAISQGDLNLTGVTGRMRGHLVKAGTEKWLEGTADLASSAVSRQKTNLLAPVLQVAFSRQGGCASLGGEVLGGKLTGAASFNPFAPGAGATFNIGVTGAAVARAARLAPAKNGLHPTSGVADLHASGSYSEKSGLAARFDSKARGVTLADGKGKTMVSGANASMNGRFSGGTLAVDEAVLSSGRKVTLRGRGEIAQALSPKRHGTVSVALPETNVNDLVDGVINLMPRTIQEANLQGTVAADAGLQLRNGRQLLEGGVRVKGVRVEVPSQKLEIREINGRLPISLDLAAKSAARPRVTREFSRENYQRVLAQLRDIPAGGETVTVGGVKLGTLELGRLTAQVRAANGLVEIAPLRTTFYQGLILGTGHLSMGEKFAYRGDLLVNGLSMKTLCETIPNLEGYISGRVDGVISVSGSGAAVGRVTGFVDLWAREGGGEKMVVSREFLQRLSNQKLSGFFLSRDRPYDKAEIKATLEKGDLTFNSLKIINTNVFGVRDLNVSIAPTQNRISMDHLLGSIKEAATRGKQDAGDKPPEPQEKPGPLPEFKWEQ